MIPFRPRAAEEPDSLDRDNNTTEPPKPPLQPQYDHLVDSSTTIPSESEETTQGLIRIPLPPPNQYATEQHHPLATYRPPPVPPSDAAPSSGGKSLSCPTEYERSSRVVEDTFLNALFDHHTYDCNVRLEPLEFPAPEFPASEFPTTGDLAEPFSGPLSWKFEFSWSSELLLFDGQQLSISLPGPPSEASGAVVGGSSLASATGYTVRESVVSTGATDPQSLAQACVREGEIQKAVLARREHLIDLLEEHYWRTHPPQRTNKRKPSTRHSGVDTTSRTSSSRGPSTSSNSGKLPPPRKGRGITGGGNNGDDDDEQDDEGQHGSPQSKPKTVNRYFACPYFKWKPQKYDKCDQHFRNIADMIRHLKEKHCPKRCPTCAHEYNTPTEMKNHRRNHCFGSPHVDPISIDPHEITAQQLTLIDNRRKYRANNPENQWRNIYEILFPESPPPRSIYREGKAMNEFADGLLSYIESEGGNALARFQDELSRGDPLAYFFETRAQQSQAVRNGFFTQLMAHFISEYMSEGSKVPDMSQNNTTSGQSDVHSNALSSPSHDDSNGQATKGKSVRFGRPTTYAFSTMSALTEEEPPSDTTPSTSGPSSHTADSSRSGHGSLSTLSDEIRISAAHNTDDDFVQLATGGDFISLSDQETALPTGQQHIDPHDLYFPPVETWSDFAMTSAESRNLLDLDLGLDNECVDCLSVPRQHTLSVSGPSAANPNGTPGHLQDQDSLNGVSNFPLAAFEQTHSGWCQEIGLEPSMATSGVSHELHTPVPWPPSNIFNLNDFLSH